MKRVLFIFGFLVCTVACFAQDDDSDGDNGSEKIRDKMSEFIQKRMGMNKSEADRFSPIFLRYFREWRATIRENGRDRILLQQRIAELRIRYRSEFKVIVGEKRCDQIYDHQRIFMEELKKLKMERMKDRGRMRRNGSLLQ